MADPVNYSFRDGLAIPRNHVGLNDELQLVVRDSARTIAAKRRGQRRHSNAFCCCIWIAVANFLLRCPDRSPTED